jgi:hypothetical protein
MGMRAAILVLIVLFWDCLRRRQQPQLLGVVKAFDIPTMRTKQPGVAKRTFYFNTTATSISLPSSSFSVWQRIKSNLQHQLEYRIPIITEQPSTQQLQWIDHFRPSFVLRESMLGAKVMLRTLPLLMIGCAVGRQVHRMAIGNSMFGKVMMYPIVPYPWLSRIHAILQKFVQNSPIYGRVSLFYQIVLIAPIIEEIVYRGCGQLMLQTFRMYSLAVTAKFCQLVPVSIVLSWKVYDFWLKVMSYSYFSFWVWPTWFYQYATLLPQFVFFMATVSLLDSLRTKQTITTKHQRRHKITDQGNTSRIYPKRWLRRENLLQCDTIDLIKQSPILVRLVQWSARLEGSIAFGITHMFPFHKTVGTFISSLLVESRLVARRSTLWGAMAAHITYNAIVVSCRGNPFLAVLASCLLEMILARIESSLPKHYVKHLIFT